MNAKQPTFEEAINVAMLWCNAWEKEEISDEVIADRVTKDLENDVIALWHDESQMNRYLIDNPPTVSLTPSYVFAEEQMENPSYPYEPKIVALKKDHAELRS